MRRPLSLVTVIPLFVRSASAQCSICTNVESLSEASDTTTSFGNPSGIIPLHLGNGQYSSFAMTCQELNDQLGVMVPSINSEENLQDCATRISHHNTVLDVAGYCGCSTEDTNDASVQNSGCSFCSSTTSPDFAIDFHNGTDNVQYTCADLVDMAPFVQDTSLCQEVQDYISACCESDEDDGGDAVVQQSIMTCTLCGVTPQAPDNGRSYPASGSPVMVMGFLNRTIPVLGTGRSTSLQTATATITTTCPEINEALSQDPLVVNNGQDGSQACADRRNTWTQEQDIHLDLPSYCGCPNSPAPRSCDFACTSDSNLINEDLVVDKWADGTKLTCGDIVSVIPYIVDVDVCQDYQQYQSLCCANFEASCQLCSDSGSMGHAEKIIPSVQRTCGLMDQYFGTVLNSGEECNQYRTNQNQGAIVDLESYCGCASSATTLANTCEFCSVDTLTNPNLLLSNIGGSHNAAIDKLSGWGIAGNSMTCRAVAELAPIVTSNDFCLDLQYFEPLCCPNFQPTCTMCGTAALTRPDAVIPGRNHKETCAQADQLHFHVIQGNATKCNQQQNEFHTDMNVAAFCGCPGREAPQQCNFCNASELVDSELVIGEGDDAQTCGYLAEIAPFITNQTLCSWLEYAKPQCCQTETIEEPCSVCTDAGEMSRPDNVVEHQHGTTCRELDKTIRQLPKGDVCTQVKGDWDFDLESFCGCQGAAPTRNNRCELCDSDQVLRNQSVFLPDKPSWTCQMAQDQAPFVQSKVVCEMEIQTKANKELCCGLAAGSSSNNSTTDGNNPKLQAALEAAGLSETMLWLATLVEILIVLVFLLLRKHDQVNGRIAPLQPNLAPAGIPETAALL